MYDRLLTLLKKQQQKKTPKNPQQITQENYNKTHSLLEQSKKYYLKTDSWTSPGVFLLVVCIYLHVIICLSACMYFFGLVHLYIIIQMMAECCWSVEISQPFAICI